MSIIFESFNYRYFGLLLRMKSTNKAIDWNEKCKSKAKWYANPNESLDTNCDILEGFLRDY